MIDDLRVLIEIVLGQRQTQVTLLVAAVVLVPVAVVPAQRSGTGWLRVGYAAAAAASTALVLAVTIGRYDSGYLVRWGRECLVQPGLGAQTPEEWLNLVLFVPASFFAVLATRRLWLTLLGALLLSVVVEAAQSVLGNGTCQTADVVRNVTGAVLAGLFAWVLAALTSKRDPVEA